LLIFNQSIHFDGVKLSAKVGFLSALSFIQSPSVSGFNGSVQRTFSASFGNQS
jgi:hypothetical protein